MLMDIKENTKKKQKISKTKKQNKDTELLEMKNTIYEAKKSFITDQTQEKITELEAQQQKLSKLRHRENKDKTRLTICGTISNGFKVLKGKNTAHCQPRILYLAKMSFKNKGKERLGGSVG